MSSKILKLTRNATVGQRRGVYGDMKQAVKHEAASSPRGVLSLLASDNMRRDPNTTTFKPQPYRHDGHLDNFLQELPLAIRERQRTSAVARDLVYGGDHDPVMDLFRCLDVKKCGLERYTFFDSSRQYTRNLISTDHETYTLLLLCWNAGMKSAIHDHPCDGCWMNIVSGSVRERRYRSKEQSGELVLTQDEIFAPGGVVFIDDSMGYHSVENPSSWEPAISLHLYSPPFQKCQVWLDEACEEPSVSYMSYYSICGKKNEDSTS